MDLREIISKHGAPVPKPKVASGDLKQSGKETVRLSEAKESSAHQEAPPRNKAPPYRWRKLGEGTGQDTEGLPFKDIAPFVKVRSMPCS